MVSVNKVAKTLKLINQKRLGDGNVFKKIDLFTPLGVGSQFLKDDQRMAEIQIVPRLNRAMNWLSMKPNPMRYSDQEG
jgi:hypothetical protein